jgi:hypothetical protein
MKIFKVLAVLPLLSLTSCAQMMSRSSGSGYGTTPTVRSTEDRRDGNQDRDTTKTAYELGKDPNSLSSNDLSEIQTRQKVRELERTLDSKKAREQYSKVLPWLAGDPEKIEFLSIPSIEGRQQWMNRKNIWSRAQVPKAEMKELIETQDIAVGMPQDYVKRSWGEPAAVEVSGNPIYKNERWKYQRFVSSASGYRKETRYVFFEGGRVVGWETE